jgi:uncharacterized protein with FMN-binding domain
MQAKGAAMAKKKRGKGWIIALGIVAAVIIGFVVFMVGGKNVTLNQQIGSVSLDTIPDGVYTGSYSALRWSTTVEVTVADHKITDIRVVSPQVVIDDETIDTLNAEVIEAQSPAVDAISGATVTSKAHLKAVENALRSAQSES